MSTEETSQPLQPVYLRLRTHHVAYLESLCEKDDIDRLSQAISFIIQRNTDKRLRDDSPSISKKQRLHVYLPAAQIAQIDRCVRVIGTARSDVVRRWIDEAMTGLPKF